MTEQNEVDVQVSVDALYTEMKENGTASALEVFPEAVGTVNWREAYAMYQAENELPEEEREQLTAELVEKENQEAPTEEV